MYIAKPHFFKCTIGNMVYRGLKTNDQLVSFTATILDGEGEEQAIVASFHGGNISIDDNYITKQDFDEMFVDLEIRLTL